jgi:ATP-dependent helicase/nuclease subunit B
MQVRFLLGPAGSGKTCRCLAEIKRALATEPEGPPLILLAPKQATFQLERQILADGEVGGYTRLQILSFDRLATFIFQRQQLVPPTMLSAEGRLMVLRALLLRHGQELKLFRHSARRNGFAQQLAGVLAELRQHQFTAAQLNRLAQRADLKPDLRAKLRDLAILQARYDSWLATHELQDANCYLDLAVEALHQAPPAAGTIAQLWLDGFAEMTPQELDLLGAVLPLCERATLAFCLENEPAAETSRLSIWSAIGKTYQQCVSRLPAAPACRVEIELLRRSTGPNRFVHNPALRHLESSWTRPSPLAGVSAAGSINLVACPNPEAEAVYAARAILQFVRDGHRFRDCAVLVRQLDGYHQPLGRVFRRYGIPFFLDRRENVTHHPLAELTRNALRTVTFDWRHDDWFATLKTGFCPVAETAIDGLENAALEFGWQGKKWREPLPEAPWEDLRQIILPPFADFATALNKVNFAPSGKQLAAALRTLWAELRVEKILADWSQADATSHRPAALTIHTTVWEQMNEWLDNVEEAFADDPLSLREWLPVLEAGLGGLTVGVIPPVLDEVLIGAIDRSRNPDLKYALLLGVNEMVFPATPAAPVILTTADRDELETRRLPLGPNLFDQLARERYLGYIACTRASEKLTVTFARQGVSDNALNPSIFVSQLQQMFDGLAIEEFSPSANLLTAPEIQHVTELAPWLVGDALAMDDRSALAALPAVESFRAKIRQLHEPDPAEALSPAWAERLYGPNLKSSVSRLEDFAKCPFRFLVGSGLRAGERKRFELDARERGNFQHDILKKFHEELMAEKRHWRELTTGEARARIGRIAAELTPQHRHGLLHAEARSTFAARMLTEALQDFVETLVLWLHRQYQFDPAHAELGFGFDDTRVPAWEIELDGKHKLLLRGRIDRIDVFREGERVLCVVMDYKSSQRKLDNILSQHGVQLQLLAYLAAVRRWPPEFFGAEKIEPAGVFYVNLRGQPESSDSRAVALADTDETRRYAYRHSGRFNVEHLPRLDGVKAADQFNYRLKNDGTPFANSAEALDCKEFRALLDQVEEKLRAMGRRIFAGEAKVDPYRKGSMTACDYCEYQAVCRIDRWTHAWRVLRAVETEETL